MSTKDIADPTTALEQASAAATALQHAAGEIERAADAKDAQRAAAAVSESEEVVASLIALNAALSTPAAEAPGGSVVERRDPVGANRPPPGTKRASFNFPIPELRALMQLAKRRLTTQTQVLRQALATELYLQGLVDDDARFLYRTGKGPLQEVVFPHMRRLP